MIEPRSSRSAFTAIELLVVLSIMAIIAAMAVPKVTGLMRHNAVQSSSAQVMQLWHKAQILAQEHRPDSNDTTPKHYGVLIRQETGKAPYAALVYSDKVQPTTAEILTAGGEEARFDFNANVIVSSISGGAAREFEDQAIIFYAQYGSGLPISPTQVAAGTGDLAPALPVGIGSNSLAGAAEYESIRFQTLDFKESVAGKGIAYDLKVYPVGVATSTEVQR